MRPYGGAPKSLLVVEDTPSDADIICDLLSGSVAEGCIVCVPTIARALQALGTTEIDAVLLDLGLPDGQGVDCVRAVKRSAPDVPIVVLTGLDDEQVALACLEAGAQDYVSKNDLHLQPLLRAIAYARARVRERAERSRADQLKARLAAIVESSSDAIISVTEQRVVTSWNAGAEQVFGYTRDEAIGRPVSEVVRTPVGLSTAQQNTGDAPLFPEQEAAAVEVVRLRKDGTEVVLSMTRCTLRDANGQRKEYAAIARDVTESKRLTDELRKRNEELVNRDQQMRALTKRMNSVREEERTRISREVHDQLGQMLTGFKLDLGWVSRRLQGDFDVDVPAVLSRLGEVESLVDRTLESVQRIAIELRPLALDSLGLPEALRDEARRFAARTGVQAEVRTSSVSKPNLSVATALFRVCQELLTNVARHAQASAVTIELSESDGAFCLRVSDNGVGLADKRDERVGGLGLLGVRERVHALGGQVDVEGPVGSGTTASIVIPLASGKDG